MNIENPLQAPDWVKQPVRVVIENTDGAVTEEHMNSIDAKRVADQIWTGVRLGESAVKLITLDFGDPSDS